jgi:hypothetical protein
VEKILCEDVEMPSGRKRMVRMKPGVEYGTVCLMIIHITLQIVHIGNMRRVRNALLTNKLYDVLIAMVLVLMLAK